MVMTAVYNHDCHDKNSRLHWERLMTMFVILLSSTFILEIKCKQLNGILTGSDEMNIELKFKEFPHEWWVNGEHIERTMPEHWTEFGERLWTLFYYEILPEQFLSM